MVAQKLLFPALLIGILFPADLISILNAQDFDTNRSILKKMGDKYDVYFTIEHSDRNFDSFDKLELNKSDWISSFEAAIQCLEQGNRFLVKKGTNKSLYHIIERKLEIPGYELNERISVYAFEGYVGNLVLDLGKIFPALSWSNNYNSISYLQGQSPVDEVSHVRIKTRNLQLREILSTAVDLKSYSRIVWSASVHAEGQSSRKINILFYGPSSEAEPRPLHPSYKREVYGITGDQYEKMGGNLSKALPAVDLRGKSDDFAGNSAARAPAHSPEGLIGVSEVRDRKVGASYLPREIASYLPGLFTIMVAGIIAVIAVCLFIRNRK